MKKTLFALSTLLLSTATFAAELDVRVTHYNTDAYATKEAAQNAGMEAIKVIYAMTPKELAKAPQAFGLEDGKNDDSFKVNEIEMSLVTVASSPSDIKYRSKLAIEAQYTYKAKKRDD